jgi:hypothetical protein
VDAGPPAPTPPPADPTPVRGRLSEDQLRALPTLQPGAPQDLQAGQRVTVEGNGFTPGGDVQIWLYSDPVLLATGRAALDGTIRVEVTIPTGVVGNHRLVAFEPATGLGARQDVAVDVATLAITGRSHGWLVLVGTICVLIGLVCVIGTRPARAVAVARVDRRRR